MYTQLPKVVMRRRKLKKSWLKIAYNRIRIRGAHINTRYLPNFKIKFLPLNQIQLLVNYSMLYDENKKQEMDMYNFWVYQYKQIYLGNLIKAPVVMKTINTQKIIPRSLLAYMIYSVKHVYWKKYYIMHSNEIIEILFLSLWLRDLTLFMEWMRKYFEKNNLKKHRKLFLLFNFLLGKLIWNYNIFLRLRGLRLVLRGKFGRAGSVRKTRKYIRRGKCSYTSKNIALVNQTTVIRTITGVFSLKLEVFF